jgi:hypothetical protein
VTTTTQSSSELNEVLDTKASYMTSKVIIAFKSQPSLESIEDARRLLNQITDTLIMKVI